MTKQIINKNSAKFLFFIEICICCVVCVFTAACIVLVQFSDNTDHKKYIASLFENTLLSDFHHFVFHFVLIPCICLNFIFTIIYCLNKKGNYFGTLLFNFISVKLMFDSIEYIMKQLESISLVCLTNFTEESTFCKTFALLTFSLLIIEGIRNAFIDNDNDVNKNDSQSKKWYKNGNNWKKVF